MWTAQGVDGISGLPLYRNSDDGDCYVYDGSEFEWIGSCPRSPITYPSTPVPTFPVGGGGVYIQQGGSWYNDLLNTILGLSALGSRGTISATGINPQQQYPISYNPYSQGQLPQGRGGIAVDAGNTLGTFVQKNAVVLIALGGVYLLYQSGRKKNGKRNGIKK